MKFICDKCGFCCDTDVQKDIWIGEKMPYGYDWQHLCYDCGKQMHNFIVAMLNERQENKSEETKNE